MMVDEVGEIDTDTTTKEPRRRRLSKNSQIRGQFLDPEDEGFDSPESAERARRNAEKACEAHGRDLAEHHPDGWTEGDVQEMRAAMKAIAAEMRADPAALDIPVLPSPKLTFPERVEKLRAAQHTAIDAAFDLQLRGAEATEAAKAEAAEAISRMEAERDEAIASMREAQARHHEAVLDAETLKRMVADLRDDVAAKTGRIVRLEAKCSSLSTDVMRLEHNEFRPPPVLYEARAGS